MPQEPFKIPEAWGLSPQQELVIGSLLDDAGRFLSPAELSEALYPDDPVDDDMRAPAKMRVLIQRCRELMEIHTGGLVTIVTRRNSGWKVSKKSRLMVQKAIDNADGA